MQPVLLSTLCAVAWGFLDPQGSSFVRPVQRLAFTSTHFRQGSRCARTVRGSSLRKAQHAIFMMEEIECDVTIVGGGPAGCTCALYTSRAGHKTVLLDKNPAAGALAITSTIANYPGVDPTISGSSLLDMFREQAIEYGSDYRQAQVFLVEADDEFKKVYTPDAIFKSKVLVLATGAMGRKPSFKGEGEFLGKGVSYCATCDGAFMTDREVAVVGINQEAIAEAEYLTKFASTVHWITESDPADDINTQFLLAKPNVKQWKQTRLMQIEGDDAGVTNIHVKPRHEDEPQSLDVYGVFIYVAGSKPITDFCENAVEFQKDGGVKVNDEMATSADGVFAIGDIRNTPFKQVVVAASDGCIAAMAIDRYLNGRKKIRVDWIHK